MDTITSDSVGILVRNKKALTVGKDGPKYGNEKKFVEDIPKLFAKFKFVIVNIFDYECTEYETNLKLCEAIKDQLDSLQVPYHFMSTERIFTSSALVAGNFTVKLQEIVLCVNVRGEKIHVQELEYTEEGYKKRSTKIIEFNQNESQQALREKIIGSTNFKRIFLLPELTNIKFFKTLLKSKKLITLEWGIDLDKTVVEIAKWFFDRSYTKFHVIPTSTIKCEYAIKLNDEMHECITVDLETALPFTKTVIIPKIFKDNLYSTSYIDNSSSQSVIEHYPLNSDCHEIHLIFTIDINNFPTIKDAGVTDGFIESFPKTLDKNMTKKIPVIGFYGTSSVICVHGENGYKFLDSWNGEYGKELIIGFDKEKPSYCEDALALLQTKPTFVVYDLIKVMSMPADKIVLDKLWKFTVTKNAEHPVLLVCDNFNGTKIAASPAFWMALILKKQHFKAIKKDTGEKPTQIGFHFFDDFNEDEKARVEEQMKDACELLKIDCSFV